MMTINTLYSGVKQTSRDDLKKYRSQPNIAFEKSNDEVVIQFSGKTFQANESQQKLINLLNIDTSEIEYTFELEEQAFSALENQIREKMTQFLENEKVIRFLISSDYNGPDDIAELAITTVLIKLGSTLTDNNENTKKMIDIFEKYPVESVQEEDSPRYKRIVKEVLNVNSLEEANQLLEKEEDCFSKLETLLKNSLNLESNDEFYKWRSNFSEKLFDDLLYILVQKAQIDDRQGELTRYLREWEMI